MELRAREIIGGREENILDPRRIIEGIRGSEKYRRKLEGNGGGK